MKSFDVFDTLVARRHSTDELIDIIGSEHGSNQNFARDRRAADNGQRSLLEIYQHMIDLGQVPKYTLTHDANWLMTEEVKLERENLYPIKENMDKVEDGDILVSDMYMQAGDILEMVRACGLTKQVTIFQSNADKATGAFWKALKEAHVELEYHIGDNHHSDVIQARNNGFKAIHFDRHDRQPDINGYLIDKKLPTLAKLITEIGKSSDAPPFQGPFAISTQLNIPWLFTICEMISRKVRRFDHRPITFLGRDCQLMYRIWNAYYSRFGQGYYLPFSRKVALENPESASEYLKTQAPRFSLFVDISSTGRTWEKLANAGYGRFEVLVVIHSDQFHYSDTKPVIPSTFSSLTTNTVAGPSNIILEVMNCGDHGRLDKIQIVNGLPIITFAEPELDKNLVWSIHYPIHRAVELRRDYFDVVEELGYLSDDELLQVFKDMKNTICTQYRVMQLLPDYVKKDDEYTASCRSL